ncbi:MAG: tagaturonate epimerase family protein [Catalinimonas sp.]
MQLPKYSFGMGDRFARQGEAQLRTVMLAAEQGVDVAPVWNKSYREHQTVGSRPAAVRAEADAAVRALNWQQPYFVDADHVTLGTVDDFIDHSDFFTLDVAESIGQEAEPAAIDAFVLAFHKYQGTLSIPGVSEPFTISEADLRAAAQRFLKASQTAGRLYRHLVDRKGEDNFVAEVSMDEVPSPQTPVELFLILGMLARAGVRPQTIAPKFTGRFNKGVDYPDEAGKFAREFEDDVAVVAHAVKAFGLPENLKLSVHTGSDKFKLYPEIHRILKKTGAGVHLKTAGTTWLEELIGLAAAGGEALQFAKSLYAEAYERFDELTGPYAQVLDIDRKHLPSPLAVDDWEAEHYVAALEHDPENADYNPDFRQLMHTAYKLAAKHGEAFTDLLEAHGASIGKRVTHNLYERHARPLFVGE